MSAPKPPPIRSAPPTPANNPIARGLIFLAVLVLAITAIVLIGSWWNNDASNEVAEVVMVPPPNPCEAVTCDDLLECRVNEDGQGECTDVTGEIWEAFGPTDLVQAQSDKLRVHYGPYLVVATGGFEGCRESFGTNGRDLIHCQRAAKCLASNPNICWVDALRADLGIDPQYK